MRLCSLRGAIQEGGRNGERPAATDAGKGANALGVWHAGRTPFDHVSNDTRGQARSGRPANGIGDVNPAATAAGPLSLELGQTWGPFALRVLGP